MRRKNRETGGPLHLRGLLWGLNFNPPGFWSHLSIFRLRENLHSAILSSHLINPADWLCTLTREGPCQDPDGSEETHICAPIGQYQRSTLCRVEKPLWRVHKCRSRAAGTQSFTMTVYILAFDSWLRCLFEFNKTGKTSLE